MKYSSTPASLKIVLSSFVFFLAQAAAQPTISSFAPVNGTVGSSVIISGTNFNTIPASNIVFFGAVKAAVTTGTTTSLTATVPAGATYQPISVLDNVTGLTGYSSSPFSIAFSNPFGTGIPVNFYKPKVDFTVGANPRNITTADLDGDGKPDLVVANGNSNTLSVLHNTSSSANIGAGSFAAKVDFASGSFTEHVSIGDVDGDGKPDLVVVTNANISVLRNTSTSGSITASSFAAKVDFTSGFNGPVFGTLSDVDGDGKPDIVTANSGANTVSLRRNTSTPGSIAFAAKVDFSTGGSPSSVAVGDVDGDGKPDVVSSNAALSSNSVSVLRNISIPGTIALSAKVDFAVGAAPRSVAIGDVDGDSKPDLMVANSDATAPASTTISVLRNTSTSGSITASSFTAKVDFTVGTVPRSISMGDLDGDGKPDLVVANTNSNSISVLHNTSTPGSVSASSFAAKVDFATGANPVSAVVVDVDGDGIPEIETANGTLTPGSLGVSVFQINLAAVPVVLTNVKAFQKNAGVQVDWTSEQEINILSYAVERSESGQVFEKLQSVPAIGSSSSVNHYHIFDANPFDGLNFYRVKIIEANKIGYSQVLKIYKNGGVKNRMSIYPNPIQNNMVTFQVNLPKGKYLVRIINSHGQQVATRLLNHEGGSATEIIFPQAQLAEGMYLLKLTGQGISISNKLIKN